MPMRLSLWGPTLIIALFAGSALAQDRTADLRARFDRETNAVRKAKLMPQLGEAQFGQIENDIGAGRLQEALSTLEQYRSEAETCMKGLAATGVDAEKHPGGFKQLQISLRESLRRLDRLTPSIASDKQTPFRDARKDLDQMNRELVHELFPRQPEQETAPAKPEK